MEVEPLADATFGATVRDVELASLDDATFAELHAAWVEHALLVFPQQFLTKQVQNDFARRFGNLEIEAFALSNIDQDGTIHTSTEDDVVRLLRGNEGWHHDSTFMPVQAKGAVFSAEIVPATGGATGWADMRAAYDALDDDTRVRVEGMSAYHSLYYSQGRAGYLPAKFGEDGYLQGGYHDHEPPLRPLVKVHPDTGRPNLVIGRHAYGIVGMEPDESEAFLDELNAWACQGERVHHHQWEVGDVVVWDNRRLMHRATPYDMTEPRRMWHTRIAGEPDTETALNHR
jgi:alpha-ketoglutarate-dependent taurine dioxygenase